MELKFAITHKITITPTANNGFIVHIGCGTFVFANAPALILALNEYLNSPDEWERRYLNLPGTGPIRAYVQPSNRLDDDCERTPGEECDSATD